MTDPAAPAHAVHQATPHSAPAPPAPRREATPTPADPNRPPTPVDAERDLPDAGPEVVAGAGLAGAPPLPRAWWFALLLASALTLAGASFAVGAYQADARPETVVLRYFAALADGDAAAALGYGAVPAGAHDLLTPGVLAAQDAAGPIEGVGVRGVRESGATADVDVTYTVGQQVVADSVPVVRDGHGWRLARSAVPVHLNAGGGSALAGFAGADVPAGDFLMFPGALPVSYDTPVIALLPSSGVVRFADAGSIVDVQAGVTAAGRRTILSALRTALSACLAGRWPAQAVCPVPDPDQDVPGSLRGTLDDADLHSVDLVVDSADGRIGISGTAVVRASYRQLDQNNIESTRSTTATPLRGTCYVAAPGTIVWTTS